MGFIKAFTGALGGTFADQWLDFLTVPANISDTAAIFPAVPQGRNNGRGENTKGSANIISNGSKIVVPEGYALLTLQEGAVTGVIAEAGGFVYTTDEQNSKSIFAGDGIFDSILKTTWERFKFGGQPGAQQIALFVNLKELPNNRFGTKSEIYWDDAYLNTQAGALTRGSYTLKIVNPILFVKNFVPASYLTNGQVFDFTDHDNDAATQLFNEVVASLAPAFSIYTNAADKGNRINKIQSDSAGFALALNEAVETNYSWTKDRGITIVKTAIETIEYDAETRKLLTEVQKADALSGNRSGSYLNQATARGVQAAGENGGGAGLAMFGMGAGGVSGLVTPQNNPGAPTGIPARPEPTQEPTTTPVAPAEEDVVTKLTKFKNLLDAGLITQEDYDAAKNKALGL